MSTEPSPFTVAAVQAAPVFLNREATIDKACALIGEAGRAGARLVAFPEAFVPAYPDWVWAVPPGESGMLGELYAELLANAVTIPSPATDRLCEAARLAQAYVVIGVSERNSEASNASLYNTLLYIDPQGAIMGKHRKLVPTGGERLVWAQGDGSTLAVYDTPLGSLGGLICWENYMPLARFALYARGVQLYAAPTWDRGEPWTSTLRHIAKEGRTFVVGCCSPVRRDDVPDAFGFKAAHLPEMDWINPGGSCIVDVDGRFLAGPVTEREEILYADLDMGALRGSRFQLDVAGHYARPDIFDLTLRTEFDGPLPGAPSMVDGRTDASAEETEEPDAPPRP